MTKNVNETPIAVVNAVRGGLFECAVRTSARGTELQGTLCKIEINGGTNKQTALCRVGMVDLENPLHSNPAYAPLIMERGVIPMFSGVADIEKTTLELVSCIDRETGAIAARRSNPPSGTEVFPVNRDDICRFQNEKEYYMVVGNLPGSDDIPMTVVNRHNGDMTDADRNDIGGFGEARHDLIAGQNGSGKTVWTLTMEAGRLCAHPQMGLFCPDTAGDISRDERHSRGDFAFSFLELLRMGGRQYEVVSIDHIRLEDKSTLKRCLTPVLKQALTIQGDKAETLSDRVVEELWDDKVDISLVSTDQIIDTILENIGRCYASTGSTRKDKISDAQDLKDRPSRRREFEKLYNERVLRFFTGKRTVRELIHSFLNNGDIILLQLHTMDEVDQQFVMYEIFKNIRWMTELAFKRTGHTVNARILLDEAPRWVPQAEPKTDQVPTSALIKDGFNTTRKYGLGWTIVTQRITDIDKGVYSQCHTKWFGRNLGVGADRAHMEAALGPIGISTYDALQYQGGYFWLGVGSAVNLGTGNAHMSVMSFGGNATEAIVQANPHIWR